MSATSPENGPQSAETVWRDRGNIIANQQARIAELEAACQRLRDQYQGALAQRNNANSRTLRMWERAKAAEADAAGLRARVKAIADDPDFANGHVSVVRVRAALTAEPTPAVSGPEGHTPLCPIPNVAHAGPCPSGQIDVWPTPAAEPQAEGGA